MLPVSARKLHVSQGIQYLSVRLANSIGSSSKPSGRSSYVGEATEASFRLGVLLLLDPFSNMSCEPCLPVRGASSEWANSSVDKVLARLRVGAFDFGGSYLENDLVVPSLCDLSFSTFAIPENFGIGTTLEKSLTLIFSDS